MEALFVGNDYVCRSPTHSNALSATTSTTSQKVALASTPTADGAPIRVVPSARDTVPISRRLLRRSTPHSEGQAGIAIAVAHPAHRAPDCPAAAPRQQHRRCRDPREPRRSKTMPPRKDAVAELAALCGEASPSPARAKKLRAALKRVHDTAVTRARDAAATADARLGDRRRCVEPTPELLVAGVDVETIWQQLRHRDRAVDRHAVAAEAWLRHEAAAAASDDESDDDDDDAAPDADDDGWDDESDDVEAGVEARADNQTARYLQDAVSLCAA